METKHGRSPFIDALDDLGFSAAHIAVLQGNFKVLEVCHAHNPNRRLLPLPRLRLVTLLPCLQLLLEHGADLAVATRSAAEALGDDCPSCAGRSNLLHLAAAEGSTLMLEARG